MLTLFLCPVLCIEELFHRAAHEHLLRCPVLPKSTKIVHESAVVINIEEILFVFLHWYS